jgi:hypothetical protein
MAEEPILQTVLARFSPLFVLPLKPLDAWVVRQQSHLVNGDLIQLAKPLRLR